MFNELINSYRTLLKHQFHRMTQLLCTFYSFFLHFDKVLHPELWTRLHLISLNTIHTDIISSPSEILTGRSDSIWHQAILSEKQRIVGGTKQGWARGSLPVRDCQCISLTSKTATSQSPACLRLAPEAGELNCFCISPHSPSHKESFNDCLTKHTVVPALHNHCHWKELEHLIKSISFGKQSFGLSCCLIRGLYWQWVYDHGF